MDETPRLSATNILLTDKQRNKLKRQEVMSGKSMSHILRELVDNAFPDPTPYSQIVSPNGIVLQYKDDSDSVDDKPTDQDFSDLQNGWSPELKEKFKLK
jgi:hypothetical protein